MHVSGYKRFLAASSLVLVLSVQPCRASVGSENSRSFQAMTPAADRFTEPQSTVDKIRKSSLTIDMVRGKGIEDDIQKKDKEGLMGIIKYVFDNEFSKGIESRHVTKKLDNLVKGVHMFTSEQRRQIVLGLAVTVASEMRVIAKNSGGSAYVEDVFSTLTKTAPDDVKSLREVKAWVLSEESPEALADRLIGTMSTAGK